MTCQNRWNKLETLEQYITLYLYTRSSHRSTIER